MRCPMREAAARDSQLPKQGCGRFFGAFLVVIFMVAGCAWATLVPRMTLEEMVDESQFVIQGSVLRSWAGWDDSRQFIWTHYEIRIADTWKGNRLAKIVVSEPGGTVGETEMHIAGAPRFSVGEEVVLFLSRTPIGYLRTCGWGQGRFTVLRSQGLSQPVVRSTLQGVELVEPTAQQKARPRRSGTSLGLLDGLPLDEFRKRVRQVIETRVGQAESRK